MEKIKAIVQRVRRAIDAFKCATGRHALIASKGTLKVRKSMSKLIILLATLAFSVSHSSAATILGMPLAEAEKQLGPTDPKCHLTACFQNGLYALGVTNSRTSMVYHYWKGKNFSMAGSRAIALAMAPADAKLVNSRTVDNGTVVELYRSAQLASAVGTKSEVWSEAPAGTFTVMHSPTGGKTIVALGRED